MSPPAVSCVIPVFNGERFIAEAIDSVRRQTVAVAEIIVADDGSSDGTPDVVRRCGSDIVYLRQDNQGAPTARNLGAEAATGAFIAFLDADDLWCDDKTGRQLRAFERHPDLGAASAYMQNFWTEEVAAERDQLAGGRLSSPQPGVASTLMVRADVFRAVGSFDVTLRHRDVQNWLIRMQSSGWRLDTLTDVLVRRRIHGSNVSRNRTDAGEQELLRLAMAALERKRGRPG